MTRLERRLPGTDSDRPRASPRRPLVLPAVGVLCLVGGFIAYANGGSPLGMTPRQRKIIERLSTYEEIPVPSIPD